MDAAILDTDSLSEVLKRKNQQVLLHARRYLAVHRRLAFSAMTLYEVIRGLKAVGSARQLSDFAEVVSSSELIPIDIPVLIRAADLWAEGRRRGYPIDDADLIIAATALETGRLHAEWRGLKASGGCQSPDLSRKLRKSGHLRTPLARRIA